VSESLLDSFSQGDDRWKKMRERCLNDLYYLADVVLGLGDKIPMRPRTHLLLCRFIEKKTGNRLLDTARYRKIEMPRETGKSTLIRAYIIQRILQNPDIAILLVNEKELLAKDFLAEIKWQFRNNELLNALFPDITPKDDDDNTWSATRIVVNRSTGRPDPTIDTAGVGAALAGKHPDLIVCDDMISREAMENARAGSWQIMHQTNRWIHQLDPIVNKSADPFPEIVFVGTRWWHNDSYEHIEDAYGYGEEPRPVLLRATVNNELTQVQAYRKGDLAIFRRAAIEDGRTIFPEKWSLEDLAKIRVRDPALFAANYMNQPSDDVTATFKQDWIKHLVWLDETQFYITTADAIKKVVRLKDLDLILIVDPGGFAQNLAESRARAAAVCLGDDFQGHKFFIDCYSEQDTFNAAIKHIVDWCHKYSPRKVYVERAGQQAAFAQLLRSEIAKAGLSTVVDDTTLKPGVAKGGANKELRILEMEPYFERGEVYVGTTPAFHEFKNQYAQFPRAQRLDVLDVLGYWPRLMRKQSNAQNRPEERRARELSLYHSRRNWRNAS
jgi:phage terminase large subunit-like protein/uncharacterized protein YlzI (FlbEa/FlbD family)